MQSYRFVRYLLAALLFVATLIPITGIQNASAAYDKRFEMAERYLRLFGQDQLHEAHAMLATQESFEAYLERLQHVREHFAKGLRERGFELVSRQVIAVSPMTFEEKYIIVSVRTQVIAKSGASQIQDIHHGEVYFRFDGEGRIELVHGIEDGYC